MYIPIETLPYYSRLWIFPITSDISSQIATALENDLKSFVNEWTSHNASLKASAAVFENKFAVISVDESAYGASGCSIDKLMRFIQNAEGEHGISLLFKNKIFVKKGNEVMGLSIQEIKSELAAGTLNINHLYFDHLIDTKEKLRFEWLKPLSQGWLAKEILN